MKEYKFKVNGNEYDITVARIDNGVAKVTVNGNKFDVEVQSNTLLKPSLAKPVQVAPATYSAIPAVAPAKINQNAPSAGDASPLKSPLPGVILDVKVREGDAVNAGQPVMILEAMKMENNIDAHKSGVVKHIAKRQGDSVLEGDVLLTIE